MNLKSFFSPKSIAVVGVSEDPHKVSSIVFQNIMEGGFKGELIGVNPHYAGKEIFSAPCVNRVSDIKTPLDLVIIVIPAKHVTPIIDDCVKNKTKNIIIISSGFSEIGEVLVEKEIAEKCKKAGINLLGPNCLGILLPYADLNASFSDGAPAPGNIAFVSQSGAICTAMLDWAEQKGIGFSHFISIGNKAGLTEIELLEALIDDPKAKIIALYLESLKDGKKILDLICRALPHKPIIILEPGKSKKASASALLHTGSMAPNFRVLRSAFQNSGAIQVDSLREMFGILEILSFAPKKNHGDNIAVISNAGGVGVMTTDLLEENEIQLAILSTSSISKLENALPNEAALENPIDLIGDARAERYEKALKILVAEKSVDQILVLLTPQRTTEIETTAQLISEYAKKTDKCLIASFVGGKKVEPGRKILESEKVPSFEFPSDAIRAMSLLAKRKSLISSGCHPTSKVPTPKAFASHRQSPLRETLPGKGVLLSSKEIKTIVRHYGLDVPKSQTFTNYDKAARFSEKIFPQPVAIKISSPQAIHKTEMKGVFLNINSPERLKHAWESLEKSIRIYKLKKAKIQVQEQITGGTEVILGINTDPNFGKVMLFGAGGIYTELFSDSAIRVMPVNNFYSLIEETKISKVLKGLRNETPKDLLKLVETMEKLQQLVLDFPEIESIDINPVIITETRAVCVDFKVLIDNASFNHQI